MLYLPTFSLDFLVAPFLKGCCYGPAYRAHQDGLVDQPVEVDPGLQEAALLLLVCWHGEDPHVCRPENLIKLHHQFVRKIHS